MRTSTDYEVEILNKLRATFIERFGEPEGSFVFASAPGRVELAGNHTDHQGGLVISGAIDLRCWGLAAANNSSIIRLSMEGFGEAEVNLDEPSALEPHVEERGTSTALLRGMAAQFASNSDALRGFSMITCSDIPAGCGVSSSAAFEMLLGSTIHVLHESQGPWNDPINLALAGMQAERAYFGKPCGAQDQIASACGNAVSMDFSCNPPRVQRLAFNADECDHALCLVDSRVDHSLHTNDFAAIIDEMHQVANLFDVETLGQINENDFLQRLNCVRGQLSDRHALRALHFFAETKRVAMQQRALERNDFCEFLEYVRLSGSSSAQFLQNVSPESNRIEPSGQAAMVILALCSQLLGARGAWRIHGGGFGGSVLAFVPHKETTRFVRSMNEYLGYDACRLLSISNQGAWAKKVN